jgi:putative ABC transport system permease protein
VLASLPNNPVAPRWLRYPAELSRRFPTRSRSYVFAFQLRDRQREPVTIRTAQGGEVAHGQGDAQMAGVWWDLRHDGELGVALRQPPPKAGNRLPRAAGDCRLLLQRSLLPLATVDQVRQVPGVTAAPLGQLTLSFKRATGGDLLDATMLGIDPASFLAPPITAGQGLKDAPASGVVVDRKLADHGVQLGDTLILQPSGAALTVAGFTSGQTYSHMPVIYAPLTLWQHLRFPTPEAAGQIAQPVSAIAVQADKETLDRIASAVPGVEVGSRGDTVKHLPGYSQEMGTLTMIQAFLFVIAALLIAAFFYIVTLQKTAQFGVLKAIGASTAFLTRDLLGQVLLLTIAGVALGAALAYGVAAVVSSFVPVALAGSLVIGYGGGLLAVALGGALLSLRRIATIDALVAIGRVD